MIWQRWNFRLSALVRTISFQSALGNDEDCIAHIRVLNWKSLLWSRYHWRGQLASLGKQCSIPFSNRKFSNTVACIISSSSKIPDSNADLLKYISSSADPSSLQQSRCQFTNPSRSFLPIGWQGQLLGIKVHIGEHWSWMHHCWRRLLICSHPYISFGQLNEILRDMWLIKIKNSMNLAFVDRGWALNKAYSPSAYWLPTLSIIFTC